MFRLWDRTLIPARKIAALAHFNLAIQSLVIPRRYKGGHHRSVHLISSGCLCSSVNSQREYHYTRMLSSLLPRRYPSSWMFSPRRDRGGGRLDVSNCLRYSSVSLFCFESKRKRRQTTKKIREGVLNRGVLSRR